jgi:hypothetical protein
VFNCKVDTKVNEEESNLFERYTWSSTIPKNMGGFKDGSVPYKGTVGKATESGSFEIAKAERPIVEDEVMRSVISSITGNYYR